MVVSRTVDASAHEETDNRFYVRASTIPGAGRGLFATAPLRVGEVLHVVGWLISPHSVADDCTRHADQYKFRFGDRLLIPIGYGALINHSSDPNMEKVIEGERLYLRVTRPVSAGEELFFSYSTYAQERFIYGEPELVTT
ncbi:MAG TPA: SET domain-containing protein-lysine N-methyltransferase [Chloroflexota bacterium]|jgi:hypothetical protein